MNTENFKKLLDDYVTGRISEDREREFFRLLGQDQYWLLLEETMSDEWRRGAYEQNGNEQLGTIIESRVLSRINPPVKSLRPSFLRRYRVAAAAILIILAGSATWFLIRKQNTDGGTNRLVNITKDVQPGSSGAILTLADGSNIVLDTTQNGFVAMQGNARLLKTADGQIRYEELPTTNQVAYNTLTAPKGKQFNIKLPDGTQVWLNAASSIRYPTNFAGTQRTVEITGEVYLEVASNPVMPFVVKSRGQEVTVLGTHFNINAYPDERVVRTTLLEGSVKVSEGKNTVILRPGEQSVLASTLIVRKVNAQDAVSWKDGFFSYRHTEIKGIMRQLSRWYDVEVVYEGVNPDQTFTGKIDRNLTLSQVLKILEQTKVHFRIEDGKRLVILP